MQTQTETKPSNATDSQKLQTKTQTPTKIDAIKSVAPKQRNRDIIFKNLKNEKTDSYKKNQYEKQIAICYLIFFG